MHYQDHPIAEVFPLLHGAELDELAMDIQERGLLQPIILYQNKILDGRNRYRACKMVGVTPEYEQYYGVDPIRDVMSWNLHRRHLDTGQKAMIGERLLPMLEAQAKERQREAARETNKKRKKNTLDVNLHQAPDDTSRAPQASKQAADLVGVSTKSIHTAKNVRRDAPDLAVKVETGEITLHKADQERKKRIAPTPPPPVAYDVIVVRPNWQTENAIRKINLPDVSTDCHVFVVCPHSEISAACIWIHQQIQDNPACCFLMKADTYVVDKLNLSTCVVLYAKIGNPKFTQRVVTTEILACADFWKSIQHATSDKWLELK